MSAGGAKEGQYTSSSVIVIVSSLENAGAEQDNQVMTPKRSLLVVATCLMFVLPAWCGHTLTQQEQKVFDAWLSQHSTFRAATDADCNCSDDIQQMKTGYGGNWTPYPDYHPYVVTGDFNSDGVRDFAVVVVDRQKLHRILRCWFSTGHSAQNRQSQPT
jgi:hypothetical protein